MTVSNIEARPTTRLYRLYFEQSLFEDRASIVWGRSRPTTSSSPATPPAGCQRHVRLATADRADVRGGGPAYPLPQPGVRLQVKPVADLTLRAAAFSDNPGGKELPQRRSAGMRPARVKFPFSGGTFWIGEAAYDINSGKKARVGGLPGIYKLGFWHETGSFPGQLDPAATSAAIGASTRWSIRRCGSRPGTTSRVELFMRVGGAPSDRNLISFYADAGIGFRAPFLRPPDDVVTLGGAFGHISAEAPRADRLAGPPSPVRDHEAVIELSYKATIMPGWTVQPDLQYIINPWRNVDARTSRRRPERARPGRADDACVLILAHYRGEGLRPANGLSPYL